MKRRDEKARQHFGVLLLLTIATLLLVAGCRRDAGEAATAVPADQAPAAEESSPAGSVQIVAAPAPQQLPLPPPVLLEPPAVSPFTPGATVLHPVSRGEWLLQIARCYGASYRDVRLANPLPNPNRIYPGMTITVPNIGSQGAISGPPCVQLYSVQTGDTWESLAQRFQTTAAILQRANPGGLAPGRLIYVPATAPAAAASPPATSHNLLFRLSGDLAQWRSLDSRVEVVPDAQSTVVDLASNNAGQMILVKQTRDAGATVEVALVDRAAGLITIIESGLPAGPDDPTRDSMLLAPNGQWAVYLAGNGAGHRLVVFPTATPASRQLLPVAPRGANQDIPPQLFRGHDDGHFLWLDGSGVFEFDYALAAGERRLYELAGTDPSSPLGFTAVAWSPAGRYLLLQGFFIEGGAYFVLDRESGALQPLPDSSGYVTVATATWRPDGTVAVLAPPAAGAAGPLRAIYRPETSDGSFVLNQVSRETLAASGHGVGAPPGYVIAAPAVQPVAGQLILAIQGAGGADGLWIVGDGSTTLTRRNSVPAGFYNAVWVPDGSGALFESAGRPGVAADVVYVAGDGSRPFSLMSWLGFDIGDFRWVRP